MPFQAQNAPVSLRPFSGILTRGLHIQNTIRAPKRRYLACENRPLTFLNRKFWLVCFPLELGALKSVTDNLSWPCSIGNSKAIPVNCWMLNTECYVTHVEGRTDQHCKYVWKCFRPSNQSVSVFYPKVCLSWF